MNQHNFHTNQDNSRQNTYFSLYFKGILEKILKKNDFFICYFKIKLLKIFYVSTDSRIDSIFYEKNRFLRRFF